MSYTIVTQFAKLCSKYCISSEWSSDLLTYSHPAALNELFTRHLLTAEECSKASKGRRWEGQLNQVLLTKPAEVVQEACHVLEKHGCSVTKELKSEFYYSNTLCEDVFQVLHYANSIVAHAPTV